MLTQCPSCQTVFRVTGKILRAAHGEVCCGQCALQFDAINHLLDDDELDEAGQHESQRPLQPASDLMQDEQHSTITTDKSTIIEDIVMKNDPIEITGVYPNLDSTETHHTPNNPPTQTEGLQPGPADWEAALQSLAEEHHAPQKLESELESIELVLEEPPHTEVPAYPDLGSPIHNEVDTAHLPTESLHTASTGSGSEAIIIDDAPSPHSAEMDRSPFERPIRPRRWPWVITSCLFALSLITQTLHHYRHVLSQDRLVGPYLTAVYAALGHPLPPPSDLTMYISKLWGMVSDPQSRQTLRVRASVTNSAAFAQPYPWIQLNLEDRFGVTVGTRTFKPEEYREAHQSENRLLAAGESTAIDLAIVDPGEEAVGVVFDTCLPLSNGLHCTHERAN